MIKTNLKRTIANVILHQKPAQHKKIINPH